MDLSIITVTWNSEDKIIKQIESVKKHADNIKFEQIIVDNGSKDKSLEVIKNYISKNNIKNIKVIDAKQNLGFGRANNLAFKQATGKYLLFLNPDMQISDGQLKDVKKYMDENPEVGISSVKLVDQDNNVNKQALPRKFPSFLVLYLFVSKASLIFPFLLEDYLMSGFDINKNQQVDSVRGSFMFTRKSFLDKLGWAFDPRYFIWFEDVDICREAKKHNYKIMHLNIMTCVDYIGQSFKQRESFWKYDKFTTSLLQYAQKWHGPSWSVPLSVIQIPVKFLMKFRENFVK
jgi:GT2 family glycosyltransferase